MPPFDGTDDELVAGLAGERTDLAWNRSALAAAAAVAAAAKRLFDLDGWTGASIVVVIILGGLVAWAIALAHGHVVAGALAGEAHRDPRRLRNVAWATTALALGALVLALAPD